jgi:hypothetical protein
LAIIKPPAPFEKLGVEVSPPLKKGGDREHHFPLFFKGARGFQKIEKEIDN